jgi:hypothetical protein
VDELVPDASDPVVIAAIEANIAAFYIHLGRAPGAEVHVENDLTWFATGIPSAGFNGVMQTRLAPGASTAEVDARIGEMIATFTRRGLPMVWWVTPSTSPPGLAAYLTARGFSSIGARPYMAVDLATLPQQIPRLSFSARRPRPSGLGRNGALARRVVDGMQYRRACGNLRLWSEDDTQVLNARVSRSQRFTVG